MDDWLFETLWITRLTLLAVFLKGASIGILVALIITGWRRG